MQHLKFEHSSFKLGVNQSRFENLQWEDSLNVALNGRSHHNKNPEELIGGLVD